MHKSFPRLNSTKPQTTRPAPAHLTGAYYTTGEHEVGGWVSPGQGGQRIVGNEDGRPSTAHPASPAAKTIAGLNIPTGLLWKQEIWHKFHWRGSGPRSDAGCHGNCRARLGASARALVLAHAGEQIVERVRVQIELLHHAHHQGANRLSRGAFFPITAALRPSSLCFAAFEKLIHISLLLRCKSEPKLV